MKRNHHDAYFQKTFSDPAHARGLVAWLFPEATDLELNTLEVLDRSFVDKALGQRAADLVLRVRRSGHFAWVFVLVEHQTKDDPIMAFRVLAYTTQLWQRLLDQDSSLTAFPPVLPVVIYQGRSRWRAPRSMLELIDLPAGSPWAGRQPSITYEVISLRDVAESEIGGTAVGQLTLRALRAAHTHRMLARLPGWLPLTTEVARQPGGAVDLAAFLEYVVQVEGRDLTAERLNVARGWIPPEAEDVMVTLAQQWLQEGRKKGLEEGRNEGEILASQSLLVAICERRGLALTEPERAKIASCRDPALLARWATNASLAQTPAEIWA